jgi:hypothetical protein
MPRRSPSGPPISVQRAMAVMFVVYLLVIIAGVVLYAIVGLAHL